MKKIAMILMAGVLSATMVFAEEAKKPELKPLASAEMQAIRTATSLAEYGYANDSASALIGAAEILAQVNTQKGELKSEKKGDGGEEVEKPTDFTAEQLLKDGKKLAGKDKTMLKWAAEVEKSIKKSTRGAVGGPQKMMDWIPGLGGYATYYVNCYGGEELEIYIHSLNGKELDVEIYDANGNFIGSDASYTADAYISVVPYYTQTMYFVVRNNSLLKGYFEIYTN